MYWRNKDQPATTEVRLQMIARQMARIISDYAESGYRIDQGDEYPGDQEADPDSEGGEGMDMDSWQSDQHHELTIKTNQQIQEVADFATLHALPFSIEMARAMLEPMADATYWRSSSIGC